MSFDKPKVTIDLDEYISLKERAEQADGDEMVIMAKKVVHAYFTNRGDLQTAASILKKDGIHFSIMNYNSTLSSYEDVILKKQPKA